MARIIGLALVFVSAAALAQTPAQTPARTPKQALQEIGVLVGSWRGTGEPSGSIEDRRKNFWVESLAVEWKFKGTDAWMVLAFEKSKNYKSGEMRFLPEKNLYQLTLKTLDNQSLVLRGELKNKTLALEADDGSQRLVFTLLHENRFLYRKEVRPEGKTLFAKAFQVGATKEGVAFAVGSGQPECIVTGGLGTMAVSYQGKTFYVCCSGCRDEFNADPARYVKEFESKKDKK